MARFQVPESKRSIAQNRFEFDLPDGTECSIPKAKYMTVGQVEKMSQLDGQLKITDILELFGEMGAAEAVRSLEIEQLTALMEAWQADSGISLGESKASE